MRRAAVQALVLDVWNAGRLERDSMRAAFEAERAAFAAEREAWAEERKLLLNAALSHTTGDFAGRQAAAKARPQPLSAIPKEAGETKPHVLGF